MDWLENLQKVTHPMKAPAPAQADKLDEFADLFKADGETVIAEKMSKAFDDGNTDDGDPVSALFKTQERERLKIPTVIVEPPHANGDFLEKKGRATWTTTYAHGQLVKSLVVDPDMPGRQAFFDKSGNEISRDDFLKIDSTAPTPTYVEEGLAKILGIGDLYPEEQLAK